MGYIPKVGVECICLQWGHIDSVIVKYANKGFVVYQVKDGSEHVDNIEFFKPLKSQPEIEADKNILEIYKVISKGCRSTEVAVSHMMISRIIHEAGYTKALKEGE